jgi:peptidoglycan/LPS O-acetylase OafA/YrhL
MRPHKYRPDIDGLRAIAVVPVVAFHAFPHWVPGGFVGVDVFFVISGYLISLIILERLEDGTFTFANFSARRIRRIFPALVVVLAASLVWGWFRLFANDYAMLGKHVAAGAGFVANLVLWNEAGYFDVASDTKPLLHLWSLGIEEQFYLIWPALVYLTWIGRWPILALMTAVLAVSFSINVIQVRTDEVAAFYSPLTRLWELAMGGGLAHMVLQHAQGRDPLRVATYWWSPQAARLRDVASLAGLAGVLGAVSVFSPDTSFPGWRAGLPTFGALLLIAAGPDALINRRVLSVRAIVAIGLISYPLYLWHWPLLSLATLAGEATTEGRVMLVALSVGIAWVTYMAVERPIRFTWKGPAPIALLCVLMTTCGVAGYVTFAAEGFTERPLNRSDRAHFLEYYERLRRRGLREAYRAECDFMDWDTEQTRDRIADDCTAPGPNGTVFLWGDSHAQALSPGLQSVLPDGVRLAQVTTSGCAPRLAANNATAGGRCVKANDYALERIAAIKPSIVVLAQILAHEQTDWLSLARALRERGVPRILLVGPAPQWMPSLPMVVTTHHWGSDFTRVARGLNAEMFDTDRILKERLDATPQLEYVSLLTELCNDAGCLATVPGTDNQLMAVDSGHLSPAGSRYVGQTILAPYLVRQ